MTEFVIVDTGRSFGIRAPLALHLVDLLEKVEVLADDTPRLVEAGVIADDL